MDEIPNHSYSSCEVRLRLLRAGIQPEGKAERRRWTAEEDALLLEKYRQGLTHHQIAACFPDRNYFAVSRHTTFLTSWTTPQSTDDLRDFTDAQIQRIIDMKLKEAKTLHEIALELKTSALRVVTLWRYQCAPRISQDMKDTLARRRVWTSHEAEHLLELHRRGTLCAKDAALQFPSKTFAAFKTKCIRERLVFLVPPKKPKVRVFRRAKRVQPITADSKAQASDLSSQEHEESEATTA